MKLEEITRALGTLVPLRFAQAWDNVGLIVGDPAQDVTRAMLCIDATPAVIDEARAQGCELLIAYHPPLFREAKRVLAGSPAYELARRGIACWSPHSALDVVEGGTSDVLAQALGLRDAQPLEVVASSPKDAKLVTFVPEEHADRVAQALFDAGAGVIGDYRECSFRMPGTGTFFGTEASDPRVGAKGRLERVSEIRIETVVPLAKLADVVAALRSSHPYEEPAFDVNALVAPPEGVGLGRISDVEPTDVGALVARVKSALGASAVLLAGPREGAVRRAAASPGSCGALFRTALAGGASFYLTGEMRHHDALEAASAGLTVACVLHSVSERRALEPLAARIREALPSLAIATSREDREPFTLA